MKSITKIVLLLLLSCCEKEQSQFPDFQTNGDKREIWQPVAFIASDKDLCVVRLQMGGAVAPDSLIHKMFCLQESFWYKIEFRSGIVEPDTKYPEAYGDVVVKDIVLRKRCSEAEAELFLQKLISHDLFSLPDEDEITDRCVELRSDHMLPEPPRKGYVMLQIIAGDKFRDLTYYDPWQRAEWCPNKKEWRNILAIDSLFQSDWYIQEH